MARFRLGIAADGRGLALTGAALAAALTVQEPSRRAAESEADRIRNRIGGKGRLRPPRRVLEIVLRIINIQLILICLFFYG